MIVIIIIDGFVVKYSTKQSNKLSFLMADIRHPNLLNNCVQWDRLHVQPPKILKFR